MSMNLRGCLAKSTEADRTNRSVSYAGCGPLLTGWQAIQRLAPVEVQEIYVAVHIIERDTFNLSAKRSKIRVL